MTGVRRAFVLTCLAAALPASASAQTKAPAPAGPVTSPALPAPSVTLTVTPGPGGGPWRLAVQNNGEAPVRLTADPRLLVLEVMRPASEAPAKGVKARVPATVTCVLPDDARPASDEGRDLVLPSKRSWSANFDPLFYCFGARSALVAGATVKASFGWRSAAPRRGAKPGAPTPPFAVSPVGASLGQVAPAKLIEAAPITLTETVSIAPATATTTAESKPELEPLLPEASDVGRGTEIGTTVTLANRSDRSAIVLFRPSTILFTVRGPNGSVACGQPRTIESPIRELYATIGAKQKLAQSLLLTSVCPAGTFDDPGVYRVIPQIDTTGTSARKIGLKTWDGAASGTAPMLLRVRTSRRPTPPTRPTLD